MRPFSLVIVSLAGTLLAIIGASAASNRNGQEPRANAPFSLQTPFGFSTGRSRETVAYPRTYPAGTIIVRTNERYLYYMLGNGQALRYTIASAERALPGPA